MTQSTNEITTRRDSYQTLTGTIWALTTGGAVLVMLLSARLAIQRAEVWQEQRARRAADARTEELLQELNVTRQDATKQIAALNRQLQKAEADVVAAEMEARKVATNAAKSGLNAAPPVAALPVEATAAASPVASVTPASVAAPSAQELVNFIQAHLSRLATGSVEGQVADYADDVDFHDKPNASPRVIENELRQRVQKWPVRTISIASQPHFSASSDPVHGWIATATFDWQWLYRSRTGAVARGVTRDQWKIIPSAQGYKIISEHVVDASGALKD